MQKATSKKKKSNVYFTVDTEQAIVDFQNAETLPEKDVVYMARIRPAFDKLVENIIFVYKFHTLGDVVMMKTDCISFLFENLYKFDATKGHKAFSYFSVIAKNWFIQKVKLAQKKGMNSVRFDTTVLNYLEKTNNEHVVFSYEEDIFKYEFLNILKDESKKWRDKFEKPQEKKVLEAVIFLIDNPDVVTIYSKKAVFLYLKEMTGLNTKQIVTNLDKLKKKYNKIKDKYYNGEC